MPNFDPFTIFLIVAVPVLAVGLWLAKRQTRRMADEIRNRPTPDRTLPSDALLKPRKPEDKP